MIKQINTILNLLALQNQQFRNLTKKIKFNIKSKKIPMKKIIKHLKVSIKVIKMKQN